MKKIDQGQYEIFTTKADAIDKFMQMQGMCREEISGENRVVFYCSNKGQITLTNPPTRRGYRWNSTNLSAEITQQDGKTYVTYYTAFSEFNHVLKLSSLIIDIVMAVLAIILGIISADKIVSLVPFGLFAAFFVVQLVISVKQKGNSPKDSEILIKELENRINAVNQWDR